MLDTALTTELTISPRVIREDVLANKYALVIIDEVQKIPSLLDEIHWCLENTVTKFILCGSSPRKLKHHAVNLLGGRAWRYELFPFTTAEIDSFDIQVAINHGLLPQHYFSVRPEKFLQGYVLDYLHEEIQSEARTRNLPLFSKFLESVAINNGQLINYANVARDCGVSAKTVKEYYHILEDTLLGYMLLPWTKMKKRRLIETAKFYFFDVGIVRALKGMQPVFPGTMEWGWVFEQFILGELRAYLSYHEKYQDVTFWKTSSGLEVDFIVGQMKLAIEVKSKQHVKLSDLKGLLALQEDQSPQKCIVVSFDEKKRVLDNDIIIYPWQLFCAELWAGEMI